ncbi:MAG: hypothetical protein RBU45_19070 [Myxococcota bacterium]|jgi:hypothetical protein|nr:hypothetical protein [Myxococcota bacterium]
MTSVPRILPGLLGLLVLLLPASATAVGLGVLLGTREPDLALSVKTGFGRGGADLALSWSEGLYLHADALAHLPLARHQLYAYLGVGGRLRLEDDPFIGLRIPVGLSLVLANVELFFEVVPQIQLYPEMYRDWAEPNLGLGARVHFS